MGCMWVECSYVNSFTMVFTVEFGLGGGTVAKTDGSVPPPFASMGARE